MTQQHDKGFRSLFSRASFFLELLRFCVKEPWIAHLVPENLEMIKTTFILPDFEKREADIIYKLKAVPDRPVYFYCLMELQSSPDFFMPVRLLVYMVCLWIDLLKNIPLEVRSRQDFRLPVIIPLVLYNGGDRWRVPLEFAEIYEDIGAGKEHLINFKYHLIDVNRYTEAELLELQNLIGAVFLIDRKGTSEHREDYIPELYRKLGAAFGMLRGAAIQDIDVLLQWTEWMLEARIPEGYHPLKGMIAELLTRVKKETDAEMFVSNFEETVERAAREYTETMTRLSVAEQGWAQAQRERAQAEQKWTQAQREKAQIQRQAVAVLKKMGLSAKEISQQLSLSQAEVETML
jgi:predicted transposase YdaD